MSPISEPLSGCDLAEDPGEPVGRSFMLKDWLQWLELSGCGSKSREVFNSVLAASVPQSMKRQDAQTFPSCANRQWPPRLLPGQAI